MDLDFRKARESDVTELVKLLADDVLGVQREDLSTPLNQSYSDSFRSIDADPNNELMIVESNGEIIGMLQLTFIPYLTHIGSWRCLVENVRIAKAYRGKGLGTDFFQWVIKRAEEKQCSIVQLTTDKRRPDAFRFYESLGFEASHEGFKLKI